MSEKITAEELAGELTEVTKSVHKHIAGIAVTKAAGLSRPNSMMVYGRPKAGKALGSDEPVLTSKGWRPIGSLSVGDYVYGVEGNLVEVLGVFHQGVRDLYTVTLNDGGQVLADAEHIWTIVDNHSVGQWRTINATTKQIAERITKSNKWAYLPVNAPIQYPRTYNLPIDPYILGLLIGDGALNTSSPSFCNPSKELHERISALYDTVEVTAKIKTTRIRGLTEKLNLLNMRSLSVDKHIPDMYLYADIDARKKLLTGLLDTDGYMDGKSIAYSTSSNRLMEQVTELVHSLGGVVTLQTRTAPKYSYKGETRVSNNTAYILRIRLPREHGNPFSETSKMRKWEASSDTKRLPSRRIVSIEPAGRGEATCIYVADPKHLFITKDYIVTHNTSLAASIRDVPGFEKVLHIDFEMGSAAFARKYPDIDVVTIMPEEFAKFAKLLSALAENDAYGYDAVIIDTLDTAQKMFKDQDMKKNGLEKATYDTWDHINNWTMRVSWALHRLPCLGIMVVHDRSDTDEISKKTVTITNLQSNARHVLPSVFDLNTYLSIGKDKDKEDVRILQLAPTERLATGSRFEEILPKAMGNPTMAKIYARLDEGAK